MGTTADKLNRVLQTKALIRTAINSTGCPALTDSSTFASYATTVSNYLVYPQNTLSIVANRTYDVTNYKFVDVSVPIQVYTATAAGSSSATEITFTGIPKMPVAFIVDFDGTEEAVSGKNISKIIDMHYHGNQVEYNYVEVTSGNACHIVTATGDMFYDAARQELTVLNAQTTNAGPFFSASRYELVMFYTLD